MNLKNYKKGDCLMSGTSTDKILISEQELKDQCTPDMIKWMVELAEGFNFESDSKEITILYYRRFITFDILFDDIHFPLLIHRAVEGWNKKDLYSSPSISIDELEIIFDYYNDYKKQKEYSIYNYQPQSLTQAECALLDCLLSILKDEANYGNNNSK